MITRDAPPGWSLDDRWYVDGGGTAKALINGIPGLAGKGCPLSEGAHLTPLRSSHRGTWATISEIAPRVTTEGYDDVRVSFEVKAIGSEGGPRMVASRAATAILNALTQPGMWPVHVETKAGVVRVLWAHSAEGPTWSGDNGGEVTYRVDITLRCQPMRSVDG